MLRKMVPDVGAIRLDDGGNVIAVERSVHHVPLGFARIISSGAAFRQSSRIAPRNRRASDGGLISPDQFWLWEVSAIGEHSFLTRKVGNRLLSNFSRASSLTWTKEKTRSPE
jgi:hypothetical protein